MVFKKNRTKTFLSVLITFLIYNCSYAQNLTGTWEGQRVVNDKKYNYTLYLAKVNNSYLGVSYLKESMFQIKKGAFSLKNITGNKRIDVNVNADPFTKRASAKAQLLGSLTNGVFSFTELGLIESNLQNARLQNETYNYTQVKGKEKLIAQGNLDIELTKKSDSFPDTYADYKKELVSLSNMSYVNGGNGGKIKYNDKGELSFSVANNSAFDLQRINIKITSKERNTDIQGLEGNNGTFSLAKSKSVIPMIDLTSGFNIPADSIHFTIAATYNGVGLFTRELALATIPFYTTDKTTINKRSGEVVSLLQGYYCFNGARSAPITANLNQYVLSGKKMAPMWKAAFLTTGNGGYDQNITEAKQLARKAYDDVVAEARNGDAEGQYLMFYAVWLGITVNSSREVAGNFLKKSAEAGFAPAMYDYALYLMKDANYDDSYKYLTDCYAKGMGLPIVTIGYFYQKGYSVNKDISKAIEWYHKGEALGDANSMMQLAKVYSSGEDDIEPDAKKAVLYATKAAALKNAAAMNFLAKIYLNGRSGVPKNVVKALALYREAANSGDNEAMTSLAYIFLSGSDGIAKDPKSGLFWARKSAQAGGADCMMLLSNLYEEGKAVEKDIIKSRFWTNQARLNGVGEKDHSARDLRMNEITSIISNIDLSDQHTLWEDSYGRHYISNDGPDLVGGLFKSFFSSYMDRRSHPQEQINGLEYMYEAGGKKIYGGTLSSKVVTEIYLKKGQKIKFKAYSEINVGMFAGVATPDGIAGFQSYCIDPAIPHASVMAGVNDQWVFMGSDNTYVAPANGKLQIAINDVDYPNNKGYYDVVITQY